MTSPEYIAWRSMISRCKYKNWSGYKYYGGRGITVCERWRNFADFLVDMGKKPSPEMSLDRINNNGNYEPGNCRWASWHQQARNRTVGKKSQPEFCGFGHPFVPGNLYYRRDGFKECLTCRRKRALDYYYKGKAK